MSNEKTEKKPKHQLTKEDRARARASRNSTISAQKAFMLTCLKESMGLVKPAAEKCGIDRKTHNNWMEKDTKYREAVLMLAEDNLDLAELSLLKQVIDGNVQAIMFHLKSKGIARGYGGQRLGQILGGLNDGSGSEGATPTNLINIVWVDD
jgi:hypothetical protein